MTARTSTPPDAIRAWALEMKQAAQSLEAMRPRCEQTPDEVGPALAKRLTHAVALARILRRRLSDVGRYLLASGEELARLRRRLMEGGLRGQEKAALNRKVKQEMAEQEQLIKRQAEAKGELEEAMREVRNAHRAVITKVQHMKQAEAVNRRRAEQDAARLAAREAAEAERKARRAVEADERKAKAEQRAAEREAQRAAAEALRQELEQRKAKERQRAAKQQATRKPGQKRAARFAGEQARFEAEAEAARKLGEMGMGWTKIAEHLGLSKYRKTRLARTIGPIKKDPRKAQDAKPVRSCANCLHGKAEPRSETGFVCLAEAFRSCKPWGHWLRWEAKP